MTRRKDHIAVRTCLSCGRKESKKNMIRMVLDEDGKISPDLAGTATGRGAYVCPRKECIDGLLQGTRISRAFRKKGVVRASTDDLRHFREKIINSAIS